MVINRLRPIIVYESNYFDTRNDFDKIKSLILGETRLGFIQMKEVI
jgi:hypothetical protein